MSDLGSLGAVFSLSLFDDLPNNAVALVWLTFASPNLALTSSYFTKGSLFLAGF